MQATKENYSEITVNRLSENTDIIQQLRDMPIGEEYAFYVPILKSYSVVTMAGKLKYEPGNKLFKSEKDKSVHPVVDVKIWRTA